jgi:outer membrane protein assembly factor BamB
MNIPRSLILILLLAASSQAQLSAEYAVYRIQLTYPTGISGGRLLMTEHAGELKRMLLSQNGDHYIAYGSPAANLQVPEQYRTIDLSLSSTAVTGEQRIYAQSGTDYFEDISVDLTIDGTEIGGSLTMRGSTLAASGTRLNEAALIAEQAITPGKDWPRVQGPTNDMRAAPSTGGLLEKPGQAKLVWISEEVLSAMTKGAGFTSVPDGSGSSAVVSGGKLYTYTYVPSGTVLKPNNPYPPAQEPAPWNLLHADDVIVCIDARSGKTVWKQTYPQNGLTWHSWKTNLQGLTPVVDAGILYAMGSGGMVYALDAATGAEIWQAPGPDRGWILSVKDAVINGTSASYPSGRDGGHNLVVAEDVLLLGNLDDRNGLYGIDTVTGTQLWSRSNVLGSGQTPTIWENGGREYVIVNRGGTIRCIDPQNGTDLWVEPDFGPQDRELGVSGDDMLLNVGTGSPGQWGMGRLSPAGIEVLWELDPAFTMKTSFGASGGGGLIIGDEAWLPVNEMRELVIADRETGTIKLVEPYGESCQESNQMSADNLVFLSTDEQHGFNAPYLFTNSGQLIRQWGANHPMSTAYTVPNPVPIVDGRIFYRGMDGIYAYDFRRNPNGRPYADFVLDAYPVDVSEPLGLDAGPSKEGADPIVSYHWDFGDGHTGNGPVVTHQYASGGFYDVVLTVEDAGGRTHSQTQSARVVYYPWNSAPEAVPDHFRVPLEMPVMLHPADNDLEPDDDPLEIGHVTQPSTGELIIWSEDTLRFIPDPGAAGPASFTYTAHDGYGRKSQATVTIELIDPARHNHRLTLQQVEADALRFAFDSLAGHQYQLLRATDLSLPIASWEPFAGPVSGDGRTTQLETAHPGGSPQFFVLSEEQEPPK